MLVEVELRRGQAVAPAVADDRRRTGDPVPRRRRRPGGQGRQLPRAARRRRPGRDGPALRRRGRRRADLPRHHRVQRQPRDDVRRGPAHRRAGLHPAHRRRRGPYRRRRRPAAARRRRQGRRQHRRHRPAGLPARGGRAVRRPVHRAVRRRPPGRRRARRRRPASRSPRTAGVRAPASTRSSGRTAAPSSAPARSCSTRWTPTAPGTASTSS